MSIFAAREVSRSVAPDERITRFVFDSKHFNPAKAEISPAAFDPPRNRRFSVYRTLGMLESTIWPLGKKYVEGMRTDGKKIRARADLLARQVISQKLGIKSLRCPHPRHAEIIQWPDDRSKEKLVKAELARLAVLFVRPT